MGKTLRKWFWLGCGTAGVLAALVVVLSSGWLGFRLFQLEWTPQARTELRLRPVELPFTNATDISENSGSLPFMAGVAIDLDGDGRDEVFLGGGRDQADGLFHYDDAQDRFVDIGPAHDLTKSAGDATLGGVSLDVDGDGSVDLVVARESGVWIYRNRGGRLSGSRAPFHVADNTTPISIAFADVNGDGRPDFFVSGYIRNALVEGQTIFSRPYGGYSHLFVSDGEMSWRDASQEYGVWRQHNTFTSVFADLDNDGDSDLVVAQDTGRVEMYENVHAPPWRALENPSVYSYPMGIAAGDFNNDGRIDLYFSNVGPTLPAQMLRGDLPSDAPFNPDYMLFENEGALSFDDVARARGAARLGFGWGAVAADLNLDGFEDIIVAQNYAKFGAPAIIHRYAGKIMENQNGRGFRPVEERVGAANRLFAISPIVGDFNGDNLPDLIWVNLRGPSRAFLNATPHRRSITVRLDDNAAAQNAIVTVRVGDRELVRQFVASQGLGSDQSAKLMIGLGEATRADRVRVRYQNGAERSAEDVAAGTVLDWRGPAP